MEKTTLSGRLPIENINKRSTAFRGLNKKTMLNFICHFFSLLFLYASLRKLVDYKMFVREIYSLSMIEATKWGIGVFSVAELITAILLTIPGARYLGVSGAFILMFVLNIVSFVYLNKIPIAPPMSGEIFPAIDLFGHILVNLLLLFVSLIGVLLVLSVRKAV